jgi:hypothetical protein
MSEHGNLSRLAEEKAIQVLQHVLGNSAQIVDFSDTQIYDFEIHYSDGRRGIGEVGLLANTAYEAAWNAIRKSKSNHVFQLPDGLGTWSTTLYNNPNIRQFEREITGILILLHDFGISDFQLGMHFQYPELESKCESIGIQRLHKSNKSVENQIFYFLDRGHSFVIEDTLESLVTAVENQIHKGAFMDSWKKLQNFSADEKHLFFQCGSLIDSNYQFVLLQSPLTLEIPDIEFPPGVTHIWLIPEYLDAPYLFWSLQGEKKFLGPIPWNRINEP